MNDCTFNGGYGFVAVPDRATIEQSYQLAAAIFPQDSEYILAPGCLPHITLYHSKMRDVPLGWANKLTTEINSSLAGITIDLNALICFGGKFIFWNVDPASAAYPLLKTAHERALELAQYLDQSAVRRADEEGLTLTVNEKENVAKFNHPLVRDLYLPHITLGYDARCKGLINEGVSERWSMQIESVRFAEIGHPGVVKKVVEF